MRLFFLGQVPLFLVSFPDLHRKYDGRLGMRPFTPYQIRVQTQPAVYVNMYTAIVVVQTMMDMSTSQPNVWRIQDMGLEMAVFKHQQIYCLSEGMICVHSVMYRDVGLVAFVPSLISIVQTKVMTIDQAHWHRSGSLASIRLAGIDQAHWHWSLLSALYLSCNNNILTH